MPAGGSVFRSLSALAMVAVAGAVLLPWQIELQKTGQTAGFRTDRSTSAFASRSASRDSLPR